MFRCFLAALLTLIISACAPQGDPLERGIPDGEVSDGKTLEEMRAEAWANIDLEACAAKGGTVQQEGMMGMPRCTIPYSDGGKVCMNDSECAGGCRGDDQVTDYDGAPGTLKGICQANDSPFGCYSEIDNGTVQHALCVD